HPPGRLCDRTRAPPTEPGQVAARGPPPERGGCMSTAQQVTRLWLTVDRSAGPDECWPWLGYTEKGYGLFHFAGRMVGAHELALTFATGERRAPGLDTCHSCGNSMCCNPAHLRFDTRKSNVADAIRHGTHRPPPRKLDEVAVARIKRRLAHGATGQRLAEEYGVSRALISCIKNGTRWAHVAPEREVA